jgi:hypothetical protein
MRHTKTKELVTLKHKKVVDIEKRK